jgi:hypothetical protein
MLMRALASGVGMVQRRQDFGFALEAGEPFGMLSKRGGQNFDRYFAIQLGVLSSIHLPHSPSPERTNDLDVA